MSENKETNKKNEKSEKISSIALNRGLFFNTASIYGGKAGFFTYGHLGKSIKLNWENLWREYFLKLDDNFYEIQSNNILPENVFVASGHVESFNDPLVECKKCNSRFRADHLLEESGIKDTEAFSLEELDKKINELNLKCKKCGGDFNPVKQFNMMFPVNIGFEQDKAYLSPETAQAAYLAFKEEFNATRGILPLGLGIIDKAYRNEISPRQGFFRLREFTQAELQIFFDPDKINQHSGWNEIKDYELIVKFSDKDNAKKIKCSDLNKDKEIPKFYLYHAAKVQKFYLEVLKIPEEKLRFRELSEDERAFYNKVHFDIEINFDTLGGFKEVAGVHYRTDHDLGGHQRISKKKLEVSIDGKKFLPHVLELSFGVDRNIYSLFDVFFNKGKEGEMFKFPGILAPIKAAVFPLVRNDENILNFAKDIYSELRKEFSVQYDQSGSVGRRYARQDEVGTPFCITIDNDSIENNDVTIRDRETTKQIRVKKKDLKETLRKLINSEIKFSEVGKIIN